MLLFQGCVVWCGMVFAEHCSLVVVVVLQKKVVFCV